MSKELILDLDNCSIEEKELYKRNEEDLKILSKELKKGNFKFLKELEKERISKETRNFWSVCLETGYKEEKIKKLMHKFQFGWRKMAADMGDPYSMYVMAISYVRGYPFDQNSELAYHYAKNGSEHGEHMATFVQGMLHEDGFGCEKSIEKAVELYNIASKNGVIGAMLRLNAIYKEGKGGIEKDTSKANSYVFIDD